MKKNLLLILFLVIFNFSDAQGKLLDSLVTQNHSSFQITDKSFYGKGWDILTNEINNSTSILLGETHFTNEIPFFTNALINKFKFDNYFLEVDPYSTKIIESIIQKSSKDELEKFVNKFSPTFSFLELQPEFDLFKTIASKKIKSIGIEQINSDADKLIITSLLQYSKKTSAKRIYEQMLLNSNALFLEDKSKKYLLSEDCLKKINELLNLNLSEYEKKVLQDLKTSREIYLNRNHLLRIQLMKHLILENVSCFKKQKNLFKFGAVHLSKTKTLLSKYDIYDIGNLISNIEDGNYRKSLHIILIGKDENQKEDDDLPESFLKVMSNEWNCFDLRPFKKAIFENRLKVEDPSLLKIITGYDLLIYIPKLTESKNIVPK